MLVFVASKPSLCSSAVERTHESLEPRVIGSECLANNCQKQDALRINASILFSDVNVTYFASGFFLSSRPHIDTLKGTPRHSYILTRLSRPYILSHMLFIKANILVTFMHKHCPSRIPVLIHSASSFGAHVWQRGIPPFFRHETWMTVSTSIKSPCKLVRGRSDRRCHRNLSGFWGSASSNVLNLMIILVYRKWLRTPLWGTARLIMMYFEDVPNLLPKASSCIAWRSGVIGLRWRIG